MAKPAGSVFFAIAGVPVVHNTFEWDVLKPSSRDWLMERLTWINNVPAQFQ